MTQHGQEIRCAGGRRRPRRDADRATPGWVLRPVGPDRALDMAGHCLEAHVAAANRADRGDNQDPAVGAASEGGIDEGSRDQTTTQRPGRMWNPFGSEHLTISTTKSRKVVLSISLVRS